MPDYDCVVFCPLDNITEFFKAIEKSNNEYMIISACSDYGIFLQEQEPVSLDMRKWLDFVQIDEGLYYQPLVLPSRHQPGMCKITDKYSVKMHTFTGSTFDKIPDNVIHWYSTNNGLDDERVTQIPFGIPDWSERLITVARSEGKNVDTKKEIGFYINFQNNTSERANIKARYGTSQADNIFHVIKSEISHEDYINNLLRSVYVISPPGNGWDCYRILEALYCGSIPIIRAGIASKAYEDLPVVYVDMFMNLEKIGEQSGFRVFDIDLTGTKADFNYWRNKIKL